MKKFNLSLAAVLAMSTFAIAGGDIAPVEPVIETPYVEESTGAFYLGLGYGYFSEEISFNFPNTNLNYGDDATMDTVMFQAGYEFNQYVAVEGRYWLGVSDLDDVSGDFSTWGIYVKPQYPVTEAFNVYALLGYASTTLDFDNASVNYLDTSSFSWGLGAEYKFTESLSVFVDYVSVGDTDEIDFRNVNGNADVTVDADVTISTVNFGLTYRF